MRRLSLLGFLPFLVGGSEPRSSFRYEQPLDVSPGWAVVELPNEVLDACRPGLPDLRIYTADDNEVPFARDRGESAAARSLKLYNVETTPGSQTTVLVDRGPEPGFSDRLDITIAPGDYIKPVVLEASSDRSAWLQIATGTVFRAGSATSSTLSFAPNDRRWWRLRLDDKNGAPVQVRSLSAWQGPSPSDQQQVMALRADSNADDPSTWIAPLPAANMALTGLRVEAAEPAYSRHVWVYERVLLRDEVNRVLLGEATILRATQVQNWIGLRPAAGRVLELEVERVAGLGLSLTSVQAVVQQQRLLFHADPDKHPALLYGSPTAESKSYDLESAFAQGRPQNPNSAKLGPRKDSGPRTSALPDSVRGAPLDPSAWDRRQDILLPTSGEVAYLDLAVPASEIASLRIVEESHKQVPYVLESQPRRRSSEIQIQTRNAGANTIVRLEGLRRWKSVQAVELVATAPAYFERQVKVSEVVTDNRGVAGARLLGSTLWKRAPQDPNTPLQVTIDTPQADTLDIEINNGDNAPLVVASAAVVWEVRRLDFLFRPGEKLVLLSGNPLATAPRYDLALLATPILSSPAQRATLGPVVFTPRSPSSVPRWFWVLVVAAGLLVLLALARTVRGSAQGA